MSKAYDQVNIYMLRKAIERLLSTRSLSSLIIISPLLGYQS
ncbi:2573_t:CDS:2 [Funneliformis caledonium]|uniref:2573_t:CDS:1 n=1 Tax=Funneliformis caledonium TaxID=1117310 RepID=A0A9N9B6S7_9GLOM|nr:2573_t:CDS:2 [Funneliformis caledonium]